MVERVRSQKKLRCGEDGWQHLLVAMNTTVELVVVQKQAITDCLCCHERLTRIAPLRALPNLRERGRKYCTVPRAELFAFVNDHGKVCTHA